MEQIRFKERQDDHTYSLVQGSEYKGDDYWKWWIRLEGSDEALDKVREVVYNLHHTFPNPIRKTTDRENKFMIKTAGWGIFTIYVKVTFKNGSVLHLAHDLELLYPNGARCTD